MDGEMTRKLFQLVSALLVTLCASSLSYVGLLGSPRQGIDDANITHVYARNISEGHGYVYFAGGEVVEGSTSAAWTALNAAIFSMFEAPFPWLVGLCFLLTTFSVYTTFRFSEKLSELYNVSSKWTAGVLAIIFIANPSYFAWNVWSLMDISLWSLIVVLMIYYNTFLLTEKNVTWKKIFESSWIAVLAVLIRPEGVAFATGLSATVLIGRFFSIGDRRGAMRLMIPFAATMVTFIALTGWRLAYFGFPFPNTYYAKMTDDKISSLIAGLKYVLASILDLNMLGFALVVWVLIAIHIFSAHHKNKFSQINVTGVIFSSILGFLLIVVMTGGDHFHNQRFVQPVWPVAILSLALASAALIKMSYHFEALRIRRAAITVLGLTFIALPNINFQRQNKLLGGALSIYKEFKISEEGRREGDFLTAMRTRYGEFSVGVFAAGAVALAYKYPIYDLLGLNWVEMAHASRSKVGLRNHASFDADVFYRTSIDILMISNPNDEIVQQFLKGMLATEEFRHLYVPVQIKINEAEARMLLVSRQWLSNQSSPDIRVQEWQKSEREIY